MSQTLGGNQFYDFFFVKSNVNLNINLVSLVWLNNEPNFARETNKCMIFFAMYMHTLCCAYIMDQECTIKHSYTHGTFTKSFVLWTSGVSEESVLFEIFNFFSGLFKHFLPLSVLPSSHK